MKLLNCTSCGDVVGLNCAARSCRCGKSWGRYTDNVQAEYGGPSRILGMLNEEYAVSLTVEPVPYGQNYRWFVIRDGDHVTHKDVTL